LRHLEEKIEANTESISSVQQDLDDGAETLLVTYGVNAPLCREVVQTVRKEGAKCSLTVIESLFPIPDTAFEFAFRGVKRVVLPEMNLGLYAKAIEPLIPPGVELISIPKVDGDLITVEEVITKGRLI
jgi:2-oxoglutarate ferredoxin oxidoreductase subunit alpha